MDGRSILLLLGACSIACSGGSPDVDTDVGATDLRDGVSDDRPGPNATDGVDAADAADALVTVSGLFSEGDESFAFKPCHSTET